MAKKTTTEEERTVKVNAKINLKYDDDVIEIGEELEIRESDLQGMLEKEYIDYAPPVQQTTLPPQSDPPVSGK